VIVATEPFEHAQIEANGIAVRIVSWAKVVGAGVAGPVPYADGR
jgi:hypothetical protein